MELKNLMKERYAAKKFNGERITHDQLEQLKEYITLAPSSFGLQPFRVKIVAEDDVKQQLQQVAYNQPQITSASHVLIFVADINVNDRLDQFKTLLTQHEVPEEKISQISGMIGGFLNGLNEQETERWSAEQAHIALAYALLGAKDIGIDSCPMGGFDAKGVSEVLDLPKNLIPVALCPVGFAADSPRAKQRFDDLFI